MYRQKGREHALRTRKIFAFPFNEKSLEVAWGEKFHLIRPDYILTFSEEKLSDDGHEITGDELNLLSKTDIAFIASCLRTMAKENAEERKEEVERLQMQFLEEFERELKAEAQREQGSVGADE